MARTLRLRFIFIAIGALTATLALLCTAINLGYGVIQTRQADTVIDLLYQHGGDFPAPEERPWPYMEPGFQITPETAFETRYFVVTISPDMEILEVNMEHIAALDRSSVAENVQEILDTGRDAGYSGQYRFRIYRQEDGGLTLIVLDRFLQLQAQFNVLRLTVAISGACIAIVLALLILLSKKAVRPFVENLRRQQQFATDASHELKTPLAIISANMGALEAGVGEDDKIWLQSTQSQVQRMDALIRNLVELAKNEEPIAQERVEPVDASGTVRREAEGFITLAQSIGKSLTAEISDGVWALGEERGISRLVCILLDNAVNYCDQGGAVELTLSRRGRWVCLTVENPCADMDPESLPHLFERFYRADKSRARDKGGSGIGLSTARAIVARQHGKISARSRGGKVIFTALLPAAAKPAAL